MSDTEEHGHEEVSEEVIPEPEPEPEVESEPRASPERQTGGGVAQPDEEVSYVSSEAQEVAPEPPAEDTVESESGEALSYIEDLHKKKEHQLQEEMEEYEAARKEEKEKESHEIEELKRKREARMKERVEEEKRLAEQRKQEEERRKAEEEERKRKKAEEEARRKAEKERRRKEAEARAGPKIPNFTIVKKERSGQGDDEDDKPPQKSKEELEKEKQAVLAQRIQPVQIDGLDAAKLKEAAKGLHDKLRQLISNKYDLEERFKRQQYDMTELRERARQMSKVKKRGVATVQVDESYDPNADRFTNAPPKILLCSKYERHTDNRSFGQRFQMYQDLSVEQPSPEIIRRRKTTPASPVTEDD